MEKETFSKPLAFTDVETTGTNPAVHEIIEIGLVVVSQPALDIIDTLELKVKPEHLETATQFALNWNGYSEAGWLQATSLWEAMVLYAAKTKGALFCAHNVTFDWSFVAAAFKKTGVPNRLSHHRLDLLTMAWFTLRNSGLQKLSLDEIAKFLGLPAEPLPHRALNGARLAYEVFKKIVSMETR